MRGGRRRKEWTEEEKGWVETFNPCPSSTATHPPTLMSPHHQRATGCQGCETRHPTSLVRGCNICKHGTQFNSTEKNVESITGGQAPRKGRGRRRETKLREGEERVPRVFRKVFVSADALSGIQTGLPADTYDGSN